jgi:hypothetical protein
MFILLGKCAVFILVRFSLCRHFGSYRVPTEVGKVGNDDPSFIHPVSERKDGIEAMFSKQRSKIKTDRESESSIAVLGIGSSKNKGEDAGLTMKRKMEEDEDGALYSSWQSETTTRSHKPSSSPRKRVKAETGPFNVSDSSSEIVELPSQSSSIDSRPEKEVSPQSLSAMRTKVNLLTFQSSFYFVHVLILGFRQGICY